MDELVEQGVTAFKAGKHDEARQIFVTVVKQNPNNDRAWVGMYNVARSDKERAYCLRKLLRINPNNKKIRRLYSELAVSESQSKRTRPHRITFTTIFFAGVALFCLASSFFSVLYVSANNVKSTSTIEVLLPVEKIIELTSFAANTQTAIAYSPTPLATATPILLLENTPSVTVTQASIPIFTQTPTMTPVPTDTIYLPPEQPAISHPPGTSGQCIDGTYTSAQHKQGACSHHGGVASW